MGNYTTDTRNGMAQTHRDPKEAFVNWVKAYAEFHDMKPEDVLDLALFRLENIKYEDSNVGVSDDKTYCEQSVHGC